MDVLGIRIFIEVKSWFQIRIEVDWRIHNTECNDVNQITEFPLKSNFSARTH
jgi:hypothetical protein